VAAVISLLLGLAFLLGAGGGIFLVIVVSIHRVDRSKSLHDPPRTYLDAATRRVLGASGYTPGLRRDEED
jgi:hypothetical protein